MEKSEAVDVPAEKRKNPDVSMCKVQLEIMRRMHGVQAVGCREHPNNQEDVWSIHRRKD